MRGQGVNSGVVHPSPNSLFQGRAFFAFAAILATISTSSLAQQPPATLTLEGPAGKGRAPSALTTRIFDQAEACGLDTDVLIVEEEDFEAVPRNAAEEAALDAMVEELSAKAGFTGPKEDRQVSRASIRALLTARLRVMLDYPASGAKGEAGLACLSDSLAPLGFAPLSAEEAAAIRARREAAAAAFSQADADRILADCGASGRWLFVEAGGAVRFEPPVEADYEAASCILDRIKASGVTRFGFVGNDKAPAE